ncbi:MAG TPA: glycoside hydrolase family 3 C-terminal domain-containing protein [Lentimicrobium sp.]|nr:glycoside hydrolase family 3 C-terminal domain-containing protein [Lentimicrobium sp.]
MKTLRFCLIATIFLAVASGCKKSPLYLDKNASVEDRVEDLLSRMTLDEKIDQLVGDSVTGFDSKPNERLGIPLFKMTDGPLGVRWGNSTAFPSGVSLAATWDTTLIAKFGEALAKETLAKGRNLILGPCVNIHRLPIGGRNFESFGEDPWLTSRIAVNYIKAVQSNGVIACIKHYALNNQEWQRTEVDVQADERAIREIYLPSFEAAVKEANVFTVMSAYNKVNGWWCSENDVLLNKILKDEWGFGGIVISDWVSTHNTANAANNGLDVEMPFAQVWTHDMLKAEIKAGKVSEETINEKVRRILRVKFAAGLFDQDANSSKPDTAIFHSDPHKKLAEEIALSSMVLLKNEQNLLPLDLNKIKKIAVIGPLSKNAPTGGGGSSHISPFYKINPYDGILNYVNNRAEVLYAPGSVITFTPVIPVPSKYLMNSGQPGLIAEFYNNKELKGAISNTRRDSIIDFNFDDQPPVNKIGKDNYSIRWQGFITPPQTRKYTFYTSSDDGVRLYFDDKLLIDNWSDHGTMIDSAAVELTAGKAYAVKLEYYESGGSEIIQFGWDYKESVKTNELLASAVKAAKEADVALLFVGTTDYLESEGLDRPGGMNLIAGQNELIEAVAAANPNTVVVMYSGTPVITKNWLSKIPAMVQAFFPGQEGGNAIAKLLFGEANFSGKLPFSYIASNDQTPAFEGYMDSSLVAPYKEGIFVGYRWLDKNKLTPTFPFGFGLSYTTFEYGNMNLKKTGDYSAELTVSLKNTGKMEGSEVVQVYMIPESPKVDRAVKELKGFAKVTLKPGEEKTVTLKFNKRSFSRWDPAKKEWVVDPGQYTLTAGKSAAELISPGFTFDLK